MNAILTSKIFWTQVIGLFAMLGALFGLDVPAELQAQIVAGIMAFANVLTIIFRTWFNKG